MADELQMENRDPNGLNDHVRTTFHDIFGEPDGAHSTDCAWKCSHSCFTCSRNLCYKIMTIFCTWYIGMCWGCEFAGLVFDHVWCHTPNLRVWMINLGCCQKFFGACMSCCLVPICESCGSLFSRINVTEQKG